MTQRLDGRQRPRRSACDDAGSGIEPLQSGDGGAVGFHLGEIVMLNPALHFGWRNPARLCQDRLSVPHKDDFHRRELNVVEVTGRERRSSEATPN
jgi:hypothetical protein